MSPLDRHLSISHCIQHLFVQLLIPCCKLGWTEPASNTEHALDITCYSVKMQPIEAVRVSDMYTKVITKAFIHWFLMLLFILQGVLCPSGFHGYSTSGQADAWLSPPAEYEPKCEGTVCLDILNWPHTTSVSFISVITIFLPTLRSHCLLYVGASHTYASTKHVWAPPLM